MFSRRSNLKDLTNQSSNQDAGPVCPLNRLSHETIIPIEMTGGSLKLSERSPTNHRGSRSKLHGIDESTPRFTLKSNRTMIHREPLLIRIRISAKPKPS